ncbi:MAG TPA: cytochrome P460 family protein [Pyrinomonadaceae bacterium]|nr:cytochrome P460 family protein [Pyrinomonadaceae bacterium]
MKLEPQLRNLDQRLWLRKIRRVRSIAIKKRYLILILALIVLASYTVQSQSNSGSNGFDLVDKAGIIRKPADYRDRFQALGMWSVADANGAVDLHYTYASPGSAEYYRKNGKFADGTVLVKEVFGSDHGQMTTGEVHWAKGTKVWFIMIKDEKGRYPGNPLWGDGWGWALYKSDAPDKQVATDYKKDCLGCHVPAKMTDWLYVQGYPVLSSSK